MITSELVNRKLAIVKDVGSGSSVIELGWLEIVSLNSPKAIVRLKIPKYAQSQRSRIANEIKDLLIGFEEISDVQIEIGQSSEDAKIGEASHGSQSVGLNPISGVKNILAVSSGKGGVGKSTVAVNLACALAQKNLKIGLLDADIYGPNTPHMLGVDDRTPEVIGSGADQKLIPIETCGIAMVSMGLLIEKGQPVIWRGPMLNGIIRQFLYQTEWGDRDFLVVDLPPGTGDAQLSLAQAVPMCGVLIVTTPQTVSLADSRRGLAMFKQLNIPIVGVVENMSTFIPPDQPEKRYQLFGSGGGQQLASESDTPLLVKIPVEMSLSSNEVESIPIVNRCPDSITATAFKELAENVINYTSKVLPN